jgi:oligosaccharyltransferase complex subunit epsilon
LLCNVVSSYKDTTPQRTRLMDMFMAYLVVVGALQFIYCVVAGNYVRSLSLSAGEPAGGESPFHIVSCEPES